MRAFVLGGTGFIGRNLIDNLVSNGYDVVYTFRDIEKKDDVLGFLKGRDRVLGLPLSADSIRSDLEVRGIWSSVINSADLVYNCIGAVGDWGDRFNFWNVNVLFMTAIASYCMQNKTPFVDFGSIVVHGSDNLDGVSSDSPLRKDGTYYTEFKVSARESLLGLLGTQRFPRDSLISFIDPTIVYGLGDPNYIGPMLQMADSNGFDLVRQLWDSTRRPYAIIGGKTDLHMVHVKNLAEMSRIIGEKLVEGDERVIGETFIAADPYLTDWETYIDGVVSMHSEFRGRSLNPPKFRMPYWAAKMGANVGSFFGREFGFKPPLTVLATNLLGKNIRVDDSEYKRIVDLGYEPIIGSFKEGLETLRKDPRIQERCSEEEALAWSLVPL